jgi:AbrB family looped-hinge helix DNA binding protein
MSVKVSSKYQVVIPEEVRCRLNLAPGTEVDVIAKGGIAYLVPVRDIKSLQTDIKGKLSAQDVKNFRDKKDRKL